ncbi:hypothetical protein BCR44DRAFT_35965 [Catenaria anguillulae PL171]|uniref:Uncharacterized protein n=1 Tax=Catenaria anguillulae PL171 TaxID=765915 RepID=A0A1Y2HF10_9FUNG|nr:hypothetical protein BCR44DRAFT_35965 [Catenaria anguillulae PL171]
MLSNLPLEMVPTTLSPARPSQRLPATPSPAYSHQALPQLQMTGEPATFTSARNRVLLGDGACMNDIVYGPPSCPNLVGTHLSLMLRSMLSDRVDGKYDADCAAPSTPRGLEITSCRPNVACLFFLARFLNMRELGVKHDWTRFGAAALLGARNHMVVCTISTRSMDTQCFPQQLPAWPVLCAPSGVDPSPMRSGLSCSLFDRVKSTTFRSPITNSWANFPRSLIAWCLRTPRVGPCFVLACCGQAGCAGHGSFQGCPSAGGS